jgi:hypothetical protein
MYEKAADEPELVIAEITGMVLLKEYHPRM